jgi:hypothetical protein
VFSEFDPVSTSVVTRILTVRAVTMLFVLRFMGRVGVLRLMVDEQWAGLEGRASQKVEATPVDGRAVRPTTPCGAP